MIGGIPSNVYTPLPSDRAVQRETEVQARDHSRNSVVSEQSPRRDTVDAEQLERRVQARQASEDVKLEQFRAGDIPARNARALDVFNGVASQRDDGDVELAGIDIHV
ncbi:UDP pyrophosphate phosphatase [Marinobacter halodurans]|uniref:UDP pyrophosphate phosphatase n=1 Tax=Marinobacter halodurans TaxID=2528979 RepID=A0ABY1ZN19_9GAMM|nr:UDP pyrophosphate phosphatase [Marinobacter halodurans]TBW57880.1 UDP pyrophosphate phosphatase [Marinobacter halodurans]